MATKRTQIQTKRNNNESQVITEVTLKPGELFYNAPTDDVFVGNGKNSIEELTPLNVSGLTATHFAGKDKGCHIFRINSNIGNAKVFSFISFVTNDYQNGDAIYLISEKFSSYAWDNIHLRPFKVLTMHRLPPEKQAFKSGEMVMFFVHINDDYKIDSEGFLGQVFLYYLDNEGKFSLNYNYNTTNLNPEYPITNIFPSTLPSTQMCDQGETVTVFPIQPNSREYKFIGWYEYASGLGDSYQPGDDIVINSNKTLYASWELKKNTKIVYIANISAYDFLGKELSCPSSKVFFKPEEIPVITDEIPTAQGGTFSGQWFLGKIPYSKGTKIITDSETLTFYASWIKHTNYTIKYVDGSKEISTQKGIGSKDSITLPDAPSKAYYDFVGWYSDASYNYFVGTPGTSWTVPPQENPNATITLYGKYKQKDIYNLRISGNDNVSNSSLTINGESKPYGTYSYHEGDIVTLVVTPLNNYKFNKWEVTSGESYAITNNKLVCTMTANMSAKVIIDDPDPVAVDYEVTARSEIPKFLISPHSHNFVWDNERQEFQLISNGNFSVVLANGYINRLLKTDDVDGIQIASMKGTFDTIKSSDGVTTRTINIDDIISFEPYELGEWLVKVPYGPDGMITDIDDLSSAEYYVLAVLSGYTGQKTISISDFNYKLISQFVVTLFPDECTITNTTGGKLTYQGQTFTEDEIELKVKDPTDTIKLQYVKRSGNIIIDCDRIRRGLKIVSNLMNAGQSVSYVSLRPKQTSVTNESEIVSFTLNVQESNYPLFIAKGEIDTEFAIDPNDGLSIASVNRGWTSIGRTTPGVVVQCTNRYSGWLVKVPFDDRDSMITSASNLDRTAYYELVPLDISSAYGKKSILVALAGIDKSYTFIPQKLTIQNSTNGVIAYGGEPASTYIRLVDTTTPILLSEVQNSGELTLTFSPATSRKYGIQTDNREFNTLKTDPWYTPVPNSTPAGRQIYQLKSVKQDDNSVVELVSQSDDFRYYFSNASLTRLIPEDLSSSWSTGSGWAPNNGGFIIIKGNVIGTFPFSIYDASTRIRHNYTLILYPRKCIINTTNGSVKAQRNNSIDLSAKKITDIIDSSAKIYRYKLETKSFMLQLTNLNENTILTLLKGDD